MCDDAEVLRGHPDILPELAWLVDRVMRPYAVPGKSMAKRFPLLDHDNNAENLYYVSKPGYPVSMAAVWHGEVVTGGMRVIGSVVTLPGFRGQGFASKILEQIRKDLKAQQTTVVLISGHRNLYYRLGVVKAGNFLSARITPTTSNTPPWSMEKPSDGAGLARQLTNIYLAEAVHYGRSPIEMGQLLLGLAYPRRNTRHELFIVRHANGISGYGVMATSDRREGTRVMEWAGSREAVFALAQYASQYYKTPFTEIVFRQNDDLADRAGLKTQPSANMGTMAIIDAVRLRESIRPWLVKTGNQDFISSSKVYNESLQKYSDSRSFTQWVFSEQGLGLPWPYAGELNYV